MTAVLLSGIGKKYESLQALSPFDLEVKEGETFGIIGPDGGGKSTILRIMATLILPDEGEGTICGYELRKDYKKIRRAIGYMPQRFSLYPDLTVLENMRFFADIFGLDKKTFKVKLEELLAFNALEKFLDRKSAALSGGMKQKLALSCILIHTPKLVILDEPTTGVDPVSRQEFWQIIGRLRDKGVTVIATTPYMDEAQQCDRICLLHHGKRLEEDKPEKIVARFPHAVIEVRGKNVIRFSNDFEKFPSVKNLVSYGDRLNIFSDDPIALLKLLERFREENHADFSLINGSPSLEDVFVDFVNREAVNV